MKSIAILLALSGFAVADDWMDSVPVLESGAPCSVSGVMTGEPEIWFRLGYKGPNEYLFCYGSLDDGMPVGIGSAQGSFVYDPVRGGLFEVDEALSFSLGVRDGRFNIYFGGDADSKALEFDLDLRSFALGISRSLRSAAGRHTGLSPAGTFVWVRDSRAAGVTRLVVEFAKSQGRLDVRLDGLQPTSIAPEALSSLRRAAKRASGSDIPPRAATRVERALALLPYLRADAVDKRPRSYDGLPLDWPRVLEAHTKLRAVMADTVGLGPAFGAFLDAVRSYEAGQREAALAYMRTAAKAGDVRAMYAAGAELWGRGGGDRKEVFDLVRRAGEAGVTRAFTPLGCCYRDGDGCEPDARKAVEWFELASDCGMAQAKLCLGDLVARGEGAPPDPARAVALWKEAAGLGDVESVYRVGYAYAHGDGVLADDTQAFVWFDRAAKQGCLDAQIAASTCLAGRGVGRNVPLGIAWLRLAAEGGHNAGRGAPAGPRASHVRRGAQAVRWVRVGPQA